jgi:hypothetical protein
MFQAIYDSENTSSRIVSNYPDLKTSQTIFCSSSKESNDRSGIEHISFKRTVKLGYGWNLNINPQSNSSKLRVYQLQTSAATTTLSIADLAACSGDLDEATLFHAQARDDAKAEICDIQKRWIKETGDGKTKSCRRLFAGINIVS